MLDRIFWGNIPDGNDVRAAGETEVRRGNGVSGMSRDNSSLMSVILSWVV
jgi:hypothetical protein